MATRKLLWVLIPAVGAAVLAVVGWGVWEHYADSRPGKYGKRLELRVLAEVDRDELTAEEAQEIISDHAAPEGWTWVPVTKAAPPRLAESCITRTRDAITYVLAGDTAAMAMRHGAEDPQWGLKSVKVGMDFRGRPAVDLVFDRTGAESVSRLTGRARDRFLGAVVAGKLVAAWKVKERTGRTAQITWGSPGAQDPNKPHESLSGIEYAQALCTLLRQ